MKSNVARSFYLPTTWISADVRDKLGLNADQNCELCFLCLRQGSKPHIVYRNKNKGCTTVLWNHLIKSHSKLFYQLRERQLKKLGRSVHSDPHQSTIQFSGSKSDDYALLDMNPFEAACKTSADSLFFWLVVEQTLPFNLFDSSNIADICRKLTNDSYVPPSSFWIRSKIKEMWTLPKDYIAHLINKEIESNLRFIHLSVDGWKRACLSGTWLCVRAHMASSTWEPVRFFIGMKNGHTKQAGTYSRIISQILTDFKIDSSAVRYITADCANEMVAAV